MPPNLLSINQNLLRRKRYPRRREHRVAAGIFAHTLRRCLHRFFFSARCLDTSLCASMHIYIQHDAFGRKYILQWHTQFRSGAHAELRARIHCWDESYYIIKEQRYPLTLNNKRVHAHNRRCVRIHKSIREQIPNALSGRFVPLAYINGEWAVINVRRPPRGGPPDKSKVSLNHCQL